MLSIHVATLLLSVAHPAATPVEVRMVDGVRHELAARAIEIDGSLKIRLPDEGRRVFPIQDVDEIAFAASAAAPAGGEWLIITRDQTRLLADLVTDNADAIVARHPRLGDIRLVMDELTELRRRDFTDEPSATGGDTVGLANGDFLAGAILGIDRQGVAMLVDEDVRTIGWPTIRAIRFKRSAAAAAATPGLKLVFADGSELRATCLRIDADGRATCRRDGSPLTTDATFLLRAEVLGGRRVWLADMPTARIESIPFFERRWPLRVDANAVGGPLRIAGREYAHGLGLHAACRVQWRLDGRFERLLGEVGIDDSAGARADADLKILRDDSVVLTATHLRSGEAPRAINVDLRGADSLTIVVDFGSHGPVQDRVNLVNPRLIRPPSESAPAPSEPTGR